MGFISVNGRIQEPDQPALNVTNRGYRYGDGLFETMKWKEGNILLADLHFQRLFSGLSALHYTIPKLFTASRIGDEIHALCQKNKIENYGRIRLSVSRGEGSLLGPAEDISYVIEAWPLDPSINEFNENGLVAGIYSGARKSMDPLSNFKTSGALIYSVAARYSHEQKWNDALVINTNGNLADATIANLFIVKDERIITPSLDQGCVAGVMRKYLVEKMRAAGYDVREEPVSIIDLEQADEVCLTNAIRGMRWVKQIDNISYTNTKLVEIYNSFLRTNLF